MKRLSSEYGGGSIQLFALFAIVIIIIVFMFFFGSSFFSPSSSSGNAGFDLRVDGGVLYVELISLQNTDYIIIENKNTSKFERMDNIGGTSSIEVYDGDTIVIYSVNSKGQSVIERFTVSIDD